MPSRNTYTRRAFISTAAAVALVEPAPGRPDTGRLEFKDFLPQFADKDPERQEWWFRFQKALALARECVGSWEFASLRAVVLTEEKTEWHADGMAYVSHAALRDGALYHELFHPVLHNAPFKVKADSNRINYGLYCECLCNAFQYFMEVSVGPRASWAKRVSDWRPKGWAQIIAQSTDIGYDMTYGLPALEFIRSCAGFAGFKKMFADLNARSK
jgi:hypothetical protein